MGQYYKCMVMGADGEAKGLDSWSYNNGAKLMEHSWCGNGYVDACIRLIRLHEYMTGAPVRVGWIGDYADGVLDEFDPDTRAVLSDMYRAAWQYSKDGKDEFEPAYNINTLRCRKIETQTDLRTVNCYSGNGGILVNFDKELYVRCPVWEKGTWAIHPLPLLTAVGNGQGGGDYRGRDMRRVGTWAGDRITWAEPEKEKEYIDKYRLIELKTDFMEMED